MTVARLADDLDVRLGLEDGPEPAAHDGVVVDDEDADTAFLVHRPNSLAKKPTGCDAASVVSVGSTTSVERRP